MFWKIFCTNTNSIFLGIERLFNESEKLPREAKINLSEHRKVRIHLPKIAVEDGNEFDLDMVIHREVLERLTDDLVDRTVGTIERMFDQSGIESNQIDQLLMVGGQSRMPLVRKKVGFWVGRPTIQYIPSWLLEWAQPSWLILWNAQVKEALNSWMYFQWGLASVEQTVGWSCFSLGTQRLPSECSRV